MRHSKTTPEQQKQARLKTQHLFFEKTGTRSKNNCYELKLFIGNLSLKVDESSH